MSRTQAPDDRAPRVSAAVPAAVLAVQSASLAGVALAILLLGLSGSGLTSVAILGIVFFGFLAGGLGALAVGLVRGRRWVRVPAGVFDGLCLPVGVTATFQAHSYVVGVPVLLLALLGGGLLVASTAGD